jgi:sorting nexin-41/42
MDDFTEDTNPFHTDADEVSNITDESNVDLDSRRDLPDGQEPQSVEPPELPSKRAYPSPRPQNQGGYKTALDLYLHSGEDVEIHVCNLLWCHHTLHLTPPYCIDLYRSQKL